MPTRRLLSARVLNLILIGWTVAVAAGADDRVIMLIDTSLYNACSVKLDRYESEVEARFAVALEIYVGNYTSQTPEQIRSLLIDEYETTGLAGVILVGQMPYALWEQGTGTNKGALSFFYEDLDGTYSDLDSDGYYDWHEWGVHDGPEIWSCWMRTPQMDEVGMLERLLDKAHDYYTGAFVTQKKGYVICHEDYDGNFWGGTIPSMPALVDLYGSANVDTDGEGADLVYDSDVQATLFGASYDIAHFWTHANSSLQAMDSGYIWNSEVMTLSPGVGALITHIYGCYSGDFTSKPGTTNSNTCIALAYPFGPSSSQASSGTSWSYGTEGMNYVTEKMGEGWYLGKAWKHLLDTRENAVAIQQRYSDRIVQTELSGNNLFGNPFLYANWTGPWGDDPVPPTIDRVYTNLDDDRHVYIVFSEEVASDSAAAVANYAIDHGVTVTSAYLGGNNQVVTLTVNALDTGVTYTLTVNDVEDRATPPNTIAPDTTAPFVYHATTPDCNDNGVDDAIDIGTGASSDCNTDGIPDACQNTGRGGLSASYFDTIDLSGPPVGRVDACIWFDWGTAAPLTGIGADTFSVRWTGLVKTPAASGVYTFYATVDDGVRLWIDDQLVIDQWSNQQGGEVVGTIALTADTMYALRMEVYEDDGAALAELRWQPPGGEKTLITSDDLYPGIDCNFNGRPDDCDLADGSADENANGVPDECENDCNANGSVDAVDLRDGVSEDCNSNWTPDECDILDGSSSDCNANGVPDECDVSRAPAYLTDSRPAVTGWLTVSPMYSLGLGGDDVITLPAPFNNDLVTASTIQIGNDGGLGLGGAATLSHLNTPLPASDAFGGAAALLPYWDDLGDETGDVRAMTYWGSPNRIYVIIWSDRPHASATPGVFGDEVTFAVHLFETPQSDIYAQFRYADTFMREAGLDDGASATIGAQTASGEATQWSYNTAAVSDATVLSLVWPPANSLDGNGNNVPDECEAYAEGDLNCDGFVDTYDIDAFVLAITSAPDYATAYPGCDIMLADCNHDTYVDTYDIDAFVGAITGN